MSKRLRIVSLFCFAGLVSAWIYNSYSSKVNELASKLPRQETYIYQPGVNPSAALDQWYRDRAGVYVYSDRKWGILLLGFPIAVTLASLAARKIKWLEGIEFAQLMVGLVPIYFAPAVVFYLSAVSWFALLVPGLWIAAGLLALSLKIIRSKGAKRWRNLLSFLGFGTSGTLCVALWFAVARAQGTDSAWNIFLVLLEMSWAGLFGIALAGAGSATPAPKSAA